MDKKIIDKIEKLHNENQHYEIIKLIYSINEYERDYHIISLLARALNNIKNYDEALDNLMYIREDGIDDPLWYFRAGYAYFHKNEKDKAKQYLNKTIELTNNNIELLENGKRLYTLCFENDDNGINFNDRIELFWKWFEENESEISKMLENRYENIINFLYEGVNIISNNITFNIGRNHEFTFSIDGKNYLFYLTPRIISAMPETLKEKWTFMPYLPSSNGINFTVDVNNKNIEMNDILIKIEFDEENDKFDLIVYNKEFNAMDREEAYNIFFLMMENSIGEGLARIYIRYVDISDKQIKNMIPLTELEEYIKKTLFSYRKKIITEPINKYFAYTFEPKNIDILRYDIIAGTTSYYETINDYYNENVNDVVEISKCGARLIFLYYAYDYEENNEEIKRAILNERYEIEERIKKDVLKTQQKGKEIGIMVGSSMGIRYIYIDLIIYNEALFIKKAKTILAEYDRIFYISAFRKYANSQNIFDL